MCRKVVIHLLNRQGSAIRSWWHRSDIRSVIRGLVEQCYFLPDPRVEGATYPWKAVVRSSCLVRGRSRTTGRVRTALCRGSEGRKSPGEHIVC